MNITVHKMPLNGLTAHGVRQPGGDAVNRRKLQTVCHAE